MSSYILTRGITLLGGDVSYRIPHRVKDGYGIRSYMVDEAYSDGAGMVITCDNGISAPVFLWLPLLCQTTMKCHQKMVLELFQRRMLL